MVSTGLTRARRSQAALALDPIPASKVSLSHSNLQNLTSTTYRSATRYATPQFDARSRKSRLLLS
jgi:hypothetical protein